LKFSKIYITLISMYLNSEQKEQFADVTYLFST